MTLGVGGKTFDQALSILSNMTDSAESIKYEEYLERISRAQAYMQQHNIAAIYLNAGTNLYYFTGTRWYASERMVGAILPANGPLQYIAPVFEISTLQEYMLVKGEVQGWQEHENPYQLFIDILDEADLGKQTSMAFSEVKPQIGLCESSAFFIVDGITKLASNYDIINASQVTAFCRSRKSVNEIALMQIAKNMTLEVHKATASILYEGISTTEVEAFIKQAHKRVGASGSYFVIVLFGEATAYPHGVKEPQVLKLNDMVLIDTGCVVESYISDITRTYVFGEPNTRQTEIWNYEKSAQQAAFSAAQLGVTCAEVDAAARSDLLSNGLGPGYELPGLPHRTGHGIGLDIHEWPYLVASDETVLATGMCFSNEPMICIPGEFGVRHEDHFYMTSDGPKWFTEPSISIEDPFNSEN